MIRLRGRLSQRLKENAEVVGRNEAFFEDDMDEQTILDLYHEKSGVLDGDEDVEVKVYVNLRIATFNVRTYKIVG